MAAAGGGDDALAALDALRSRVVATGEKAITEAMHDAEELAAECEGAPALEVDGVLDMT